MTALDPGSMASIADNIVDAMYYHGLGNNQADATQIPNIMRCVSKV